MIVWDLDAGTLPDGPVATWPGVGVTLTQSGPNAPIAAGGVLTFGDPNVIMGPAILAGDATALADGGAIHLVVRVVGTPTSEMQQVRWADIGVVFGNGVAGTYGLLAPVSGWAVVTVEFLGGDRVVWVNGVRVGAVEDGLTPSGTVVELANYLDASLEVKRVVGSDGDTETVAAALASEYLAPPGEVTAAARETFCLSHQPMCEWNEAFRLMRQPG